MGGNASYPAARLDPDRTTGLILCGMGGPDGPESVEPFLRNLFADPAIFPVPWPVGPLLGRMIARRRAPKVRARYQRISPDGASPQLPETRRQAEAVARLLNEAGLSALPGVAMRYWHPMSDQTVGELLESGAEQFIAVPTYPQFSSATNGSTLDHLLDALGRLAPGAAVHVVPEWHLLDGLIETLAASVAATLGAWAEGGRDPGECALVYVAHSLPEKLDRQGDPYLAQTEATVAAVHQRVAASLAEAEHGSWWEELTSAPDPLLAFQSRVGPIRWLGPEVRAETTRLAEAGRRRLMVQPVSFTCEHIETLMELDIELRELALSAGIREFQRGPALNHDPRWLGSLAAELARRAFDMEVEPNV